MDTNKAYKTKKGLHTCFKNTVKPFYYKDYSV